MSSQLIWSAWQVQFVQNSCEFGLKAAPGLQQSPLSKLQSWILARSSHQPSPMSSLNGQASDLLLLTSTFNIILESSGFRSAMVNMTSSPSAANGIRPKKSLDRARPIKTKTVIRTASHFRTTNKWNRRSNHLILMENIFLTDDVILNMRSMRESPNRRPKLLPMSEMYMSAL